VAQSEIVHAFLEGTTCRDLVRELEHSPPVDSNELFDIATSFASGEEAVGAIFDGKKGKRVDGTPAEGSKSKEPQQKHKRGKKRKKPCSEAREQGRDDDGDEALAVDPARRGPRPTPRGPGVFDDRLKKPCHYHKTPVNHTLEQCDMLKRFYDRAAAKDGEAKKDGVTATPVAFPRWRMFSSCSGGPTVDMSNSQRKRERHKVLAAEKAPPSFLDWSGDAITVSREDHPNRIPNPGQYPLVVDPVIGNARFSKVTGVAASTSSTRTLCACWGSGWTSCGPARRRSMASHRASASSPSGRSICRSSSAHRTTSARKRSPSRWWGSEARTTPSLGDRATPSSWRSPTTPMLMVNFRQPRVLVIHWF
jgi:hypothetical protein